MTARKQVEITLPRKPGRHLDASQSRQVAVKAECDPRTVSKYLRGDAVMPMVRRRIERALAEQGFGSLVWPAEGTT